MNTYTVGVLITLVGALVAVYGGWLEITGTQTGAVNAGLAILLFGSLVSLLGATK